MAITITQTIVLKCTVTAEYTDLLTKASAWKTAQPDIVNQVSGDGGKKQVTVVTKAYPFEPTTTP